MVETVWCEMAFSSAGVASANVSSARGRAVIWRMSHEMLLNYAENCKGGSQLVLNIAAFTFRSCARGKLEAT